MLWKYKKCYQEASEDVLEACLSIPTINYVNEGNPLAEITIESTDCRYNNTGTIIVGVGINGIGCVTKNSIITITWSDATVVTFDVNDLYLLQNTTYTAVNTAGEYLEMTIESNCN